MIIIHIGSLSVAHHHIISIDNSLSSVFLTHHTRIVPPLVSVFYLSTMAMDLLSLCKKFHQHDITRFEVVAFIITQFQQNNNLPMMYCYHHHLTLSLPHQKEIVEVNFQRSKICGFVLLLGW